MGITTFNRWRRMEAQKKLAQKEVKIEREVTENKQAETVEKPVEKPAEKTVSKTPSRTKRQ